MAKRSKQYSFHLNLNNPDHLKIYRTLEDLNTDIHKSVSNFVIKAVIQYIKPQLMFIDNCLSKEYILERDWVS